MYDLVGEIGPGFGSFTAIVMLVKGLEEAGNHNFIWDFCRLDFFFI